MKKRFEKETLSYYVTPDWHCFLANWNPNGQDHLRSPRLNPTEQLKYGVSLSVHS